jgi:hypothetical protein
VVRYDETGKFDVKLTVSDGIHTKTILRQKYIHVDECSGVGEHATAPPLFKLFPNPANDQVTIGVNPDVSGSCKVMLFDVTGCMIKEFQQIIPQGNRFVMDLAGLGTGLYFIRLQAKSSTSTLKLIIN